MNHTEVRAVLGDLGEKLYFSLFGGKQNEDWFDSTGDGFNGLRELAEVKTQRLFLKMGGAVTISDTETQLNKCLTVKRFIAVVIPQTGSKIQIREVIDRTYERYTTSKGKKMIAFRNHVLLTVHDDLSLANQMRELSQSTYFKG